MNVKQAALIAALCLPNTLWAADLDVQMPWVRGTVPGQKVTGGFMELKSAAGATLVGASSPAAGLVEIHEMKMDGGVMQMRPLARLPLPAGKTVSLAAGGYHLMLMDLKAPLKAGDSVPLTLRVEAAGGKTEKVEVKAMVKDLASPAEHHHH